MNKKFRRARFLIILALFLMPSFSFANSLDDQIRQTEQQLNQTTAQKKTLSSEVATFDGQIASLQGQINNTISSINETQAEITATSEKIVRAEAEIKKQQGYLGDIMRTMYEEGQVSTIELVAKSQNFSDFVDRSEYLESINLKIKDMVDKVFELKKGLEQSKNQLEQDKAKNEQLKKDQLLQQQALSTQRSAKNSLLVRTKGQEQAFQGTLEDLYAERARRSRENNEGSTTGGTGGYPYPGANPNGVDPWGFYFRQCTSYAAWRSANYGPIPATILSDWGTEHTVYPNNADGGNWGNLAVSHGRPVSSTPSAGSVMSFPRWSVPGGYGHVAYVDSVNGDGTVNISEYNYEVRLGFGQRTGVNPWNYGAVFIR